MVVLKSDLLIVSESLEGSTLAFPRTVSPRSLSLVTIIQSLKCTGHRSLPIVLR